MNEEQAYEEMNQAEREFEDAQNEAEKVRRQFRDTMEGGQRTACAERALNEEGIRELDAVETVERQNLEAYQNACRKYFELLRSSN